MISRFISVQETLQMLKCLCVIDIRVLGAGGRWGIHHVVNVMAFK